MGRWLRHPGTVANKVRLEASRPSACFRLWRGDTTGEVGKKQGAITEIDVPIIIDVGASEVQSTTTSRRSRDAWPIETTGDRGPICVVYIAVIVQVARGAETKFLHPAITGIRNEDVAVVASANGVWKVELANSRAEGSPLGYENSVPCE